MRGVQVGRYPLTPAERKRRSRAALRGTLKADDPRHGTPVGYDSYGCRCRPCTDAEMDRVRPWKQANR